MKRISPADRLALVLEENARLREFRLQILEAFQVTECLSKPSDIVGLWQDWATAKARVMELEAQLVQVVEG